MSRLHLSGKLVLENDKKYISVVSNGGSTYVLPIEADGCIPDGSWVDFSGQLCTASVPEGAKMRKLHFGVGTLKKSIFVGYQNELSITSGTLAHVSELRTTPLTSRKVVDFIVADEGSRYNCIAFGGVAQRLLETKKVGDPINIYMAAFHSRIYVKEGEFRTAYEVCVKRFV